MASMVPSAMRDSLICMWVMKDLRRFSDRCKVKFGVSHHFHLAPCGREATGSAFGMTA
jgi:hypothetical protein